MVDREEGAPLTDEEYAWVMHWAKRGGADDPREHDRFRMLCQRLDASIPDQEHDERTAYHEAAHAVVVSALGRPVPFVFIRHDHTGKTGGLGLLASTEIPEEVLQHLLRFTTVSVAGYVAEEMHWGYASVPEHNLFGNVVVELGKFEHIERPMPEAIRAVFARGTGLDEVAAALIEEREGPARRILRANWATVERLALELVRRRHIEGEDLAALLADVGMTSEV